MIIIIKVPIRSVSFNFIASLLLLIQNAAVLSSQNHRDRPVKSNNKQGSPSLYRIGTHSVDANKYGRHKWPIGNSNSIVSAFILF